MNLKKRISILGCIALVLIGALVSFQLTYHFVGSQYQVKLDEGITDGPDFTKLAQADQLIREYFLGNIDEESLEDGSIRGYVAGLNDPYSRYLTPEEYAQYLQGLTGAASGIGIRATQDPKSGAIVVYGVLADSPAEEAGIRKGDILYKVDDALAEDLGFFDAIKALSGEIGSKVQVSFLREVAAQEMELVFTFTRTEVSVNSIYAEMLSDTVGYIQIYSFDTDTDVEFMLALDQLIQGGAESLIFDVRNNTGGSLTAVTEILDRLIPEGVLYYRSDAEGNEEAVTSGLNALSMPMAVLINERSASASELFAAVLQDWDLAVLVGNTTYGKGSGQKVIELEDGSAMILTDTRFRPAFSDSFDGKGVKPDVPCDLGADNLYLLTRPEDKQLQRAVSELEK